MLQAAARAPQYFSQLLLIDPVIMSPDIYTARITRTANGWMNPASSSR